MSSSPVCIVEFGDGETTRMTTWSEMHKPDLRRGIKLALAAYESRTKRRPPAIAKVKFELDDGTAIEIPAKQLAKALDDCAPQRRIFERREHAQ